MKRIFVCSFLVGMGLFLSACPKPVCGDGVVDAELGEACDDGNNIDADGCEADCSLPACENGIQDPGEICFVAKTFDTGLGSDPRAVTLGDFNEDGLLDLAAEVSEQLGIFLNLGEEQLAEPILVPLSGGINDIVTEDFNADGHLDLAVTSRGTDSLDILFGQGDGQFILENTLVVGDGPSSILAGRFDNGAGPGLASIDLVIGNFNSFDITVLFNDGVGNFSEAPDSPLALPGRPEALASGDFDSGSGTLDFVVITQVPDEVNAFFGVGFDQFAGPFLLTDQIVPSDVAVGDLDQNGSLDILMTHNDFSLQVFLGGNDQTFTPGEPITLGKDVGDAFLSPILADLNNDGVPDIAVAATQAGVQVLPGQGGGQFSAPIVFEAGFGLALAVGDLNGDSLLDLVVPNGDEDRVTVLFSRP